MGILVARTGEAMMSGPNLGVAADIYGSVSLASKNLIPDPGLRESDTNGNGHRYWQLESSDRPTGWANYIRDNAVVKNMSRQNTQPLSLGEDKTWQKSDALIFGPGWTDPARAAAIARPGPPRFKVIDTGQHGYPAGWYCLAYAYTYGTNVKNTGRVTMPSARSEPFELATGFGMVIELPVQLPENVSGVVIYLSEPKGTELAARNAQLWEQVRIPAGNLKDIRRMTGPLHTKMKNRSVNRTKIGEPTSDIRTRKFFAPFNQREMSFQVAYSLFTASGLSKSSRVWPNDDGWTSASFWYVGAKDNSVWTFKPRSFPHGVIGWRPEIRGRDVNTGKIGTWHAVTPPGIADGFHKKDMWGWFYAPTPEEWPKNAKASLLSIERDREDTTGVENPEDEYNGLVEILDLPLSSGLTPGPHWARQSLWVDELEGPVGPPVRIDVPTTGKAIRFLRPLFHNKIDNEDTSELTNAGTPRGWTIHVPQPVASPEGVLETSHTGVLVTDGEGGPIIDDATSASTDVDVLSSPEIPVDEADPEVTEFTIEYDLEFLEWEGGAIEAVLDEFDDVGTLLGTQPLSRHWPAEADEEDAPVALAATEPEGAISATQIIHNVKRTISTNTALTSNVSRTVLNTATKKVKVRFRALGSLAGLKSALRKFIARIINIGMLPGKAKPKKRVDPDKPKKKRVKPQQPPKKPGDTTETEPDDPKEQYKWSFPHGGYCVIVEDPVDGARYTEEDNALFSDEFEAADKLLHPRWTKTTTANAVAHITPVAALRGEQGLRVHKTAAGAAENAYISTSLDTTIAGQGTLKFECYIKRMPASDPVTLARIVGTAGGIMGQVVLHPNGVLRVSAVNSAGTLVEGVPAGRGLSKDDRFTVEMFIQGGGTANGTLKTRVGLNYRAVRSIADITGVDWSTRTPGEVRIGVTESSTTNEWTFFYDRVWTGEKRWRLSPRLPGNMIDYYAPPKTPQRSYFGPTGMKVPIQPGQEYTLQVRVDWEDLQQPTDLLRMLIHAKNGRILRNMGPLVENIEGSNPSDEAEGDWIMFTHTFTAPAGAAYLHFAGNRLGAGRVRLMGLQMEKGAVATRYTDEYGTSGYFNVLFDSNIPGVSQESYVEYLNRVSRIIGSNVLSEKPEGTDVIASYASSDAPDSGFTTYYADIQQLPLRRYIRAQIDLSTTNVTITPAVDGVGVYLKRPVSVLCRNDGTEYEGGTLVNDISAPKVRRDIERTKRATGAESFVTTGTVVNRYLTGLRITVFRDSVVEEITESIGKEDSEFVIETHKKRYTVRILEADFSPRSRTRRELPDGEMFCVHDADGVEALIVGEVDL